MFRWPVVLILLGFCLPNMGQSSQNFNGSASIIHRELSFGFQLHPRGMGANVQTARLIKPRIWRSFDFDLVSMKHPKEFRIRSSSQAPGTFIFGKLNSLFLLRAGYGRKYELSTKLYRNTIGTSISWHAGPLVGFLKPVYLEIFYPSPDNQYGYLVSERYNPETHTNIPRIYGTSAFTRGIGESSFRLGAFAKGSLTFDWSSFSDIIQAVELGGAVDIFPREVPILAFAQNKKVFTSLYLCVHIGSRW